MTMIIMARFGQGGVEYRGVVAHHAQVSAGIALTGQRIRVKRACNGQAGFFGQLHDNGLVGHVLVEQRLNILLLDHVHQRCHAGAAGVCFGREPHRRQEVDSIGTGEVTEGVVAGDDAGGSRDLTDQRTNLGIQLRHFSQVAIGIGLVLLGVVRIDFHQTVADVLDVDPRLGHVLPGMGIIVAVLMVIMAMTMFMSIVPVIVAVSMVMAVAMSMIVAMPVIMPMVVPMVVIVMPMIVMARVGQGVDAICRGDHRALIVAGVDQSLHPAFEQQAVEDHQIGLGQRPGIAWARRVDVCIAVRADQGSDLDMLTAHVLDHIGQNREAGDHLHTLIGDGGRQGQHGRNAYQPAGGMGKGHDKLL